MVRRKVLPALARARLMASIAILFGLFTVVGVSGGTKQPLLTFVVSVLLAVVLVVVQVATFRQRRRKHKPIPEFVSSSELPPAAALWKTAALTVVAIGCIDAALAAFAIQDGNSVLSGFALYPGLLGLVFGVREAREAERTYAGRLWIPVSTLRSTPDPDWYIVRPST